MPPASSEKDASLQQRMITCSARFVISFKRVSV
jgi:hypothetical protein